jgi:hypothetical protein
MRAGNHRLPAIVLAVVVATGSIAAAQFGFPGFGDFYRPLPNIPYDGRFTFVRVRYEPAAGGYKLGVNYLIYGLTH